jgi:dTDP-4-amino-4,6-dideoxygalactose transaminase
MSLHGLSRDAWDRYSGGRQWDYRIVAPGYKYNLTDVAAAIGLHQLHRAEDMRRAREARALAYLDALADLAAVELPAADANRIHAWHLFPLRLRLEALSIDRNRFMDELKDAGVGCSVHWRPLHAHPYYQERFAFTLADFPVATAQFERLVSIPLSSAMSDADLEYVVDTVRSVTRRFRR